jgi:hypothetical protein
VPSFVPSAKLLIICCFVVPNQEIAGSIQARGSIQSISRSAIPLWLTASSVGWFTMRIGSRCGVIPCGRVGGSRATTLHTNHSARGQPTAGCGDPKK